MKPVQNFEENLYPAMQFRPVLSLPVDAKPSEKLMNGLRLQKVSTEDPTAKISVATKGLQHWVCTDETLCHKKQAMHLFLAAHAMFTKRAIASFMWLNQDSSKNVSVELPSGAVSLSEPIQIFLAQSGFAIEPKATVLSLKDFENLVPQSPRLRVIEAA
jgi:hypothetical protein